MKRLLVLFVFLFTVLFTYTVIAQEFGSIRKSIEFSIPEKIQNPVLDPLPAGTYTIGTGGNFATIQDAFNKLSTDGVAGEVILELIDNLYIAPSDSFGFFLNGPIPGAGPNSRVTITPAQNKNVTIEGNGQIILNFINTSYLTLDGVGLTGSTTLTIHSLSSGAFDFTICSAFQNNSDHNVVQNIVFLSENYTKNGFGPSFWTRIGLTVTADSNLIQNNFIKKAGCGIYVSSYNSSLRAEGNIIRGNYIGSDVDSLIAWGIQVEHGHNTIIENNIVQNLKVTTTIGEILIPGINSYRGNGDIIRNNVVHSLKASGGYTSVGILLSGEGSWYGSNNMVYNNMVYDIQSTSTQGDSRVAGIQVWMQQNPKIYYNSVYLSGTGANHYGSGALYIWNTCSNVEAKDNILVNTRDESLFCSSSIYIRGSNSILATSDYNDLYYDNSNPHNCLVRASSDYLTLADWQATGKDLQSITEMPNFIDPYLHIEPAIPTNIESHATPIAGITTDFDGNTRNATTPDIGADEFTGAEGIVWIMQQLPESDLMIQVKAVDLSTAWALGLHGGIFRTTDSGITWTSAGTSLSLGEGVTVCIDAISAATAFVVGLNYDPTNVPPPPADTTFIWRTTDGGATWQIAYTQLHGFLDAVQMISPTEGIAVGDPVEGKFTILRTTDAGVSWSRIPTEPFQLNSEAGIFRALCTYGSNYIWFGTWVGNNSSSAVYHSTDAGATWTRSPDLFPDWVSTVWFSDPQHGISNELSFARSTDGGFTWIPITDLPAGHWYHDQFTTTAVTGGKDYWAVVDNAIYRSTDLGESWNISYAGIDTLTFASFVTVGDFTAGWVTSLGNKIVACNFYNPTDVHETVNGEIPTEFKLSQNYPNPFNPSTTISWQSPIGSQQTLKIFDILGNEVAALVDEYKPAGRYEVEFNAANLPSRQGSALTSGVYFYQLKAGDPSTGSGQAFIQTRKMILIK
jgi:photosystem II stability/assembly factor-like uncharacterized protein